MPNETLPKSLQDLPELFVLAMVAGGILIGRLNNRGRPRRGQGGSVDGLSSDDGPHHHSWWDSGTDDGGHHGAGIAVVTINPERVGSNP